MLKLKLQYFGHLMRRVDSLEKTLMLGGIFADDARVWQCPFVLCLHPQGCLRRGVRVLERVAISFSRGSSQFRDRTHIYRIAGRCFNL